MRHVPLAALACVVLLVGSPQIGNADDLEREVGLGRYYDSRFVAQSTLILCPEVERRVTEIGNRVAAAAGRDDLSYTFRVVNDPVINAYATAGGYVYINTGMLDVIRSEDELAAVLAHEIAHTAERHMLRQMDVQHQIDMVTGAVSRLGAEFGGMIGSAAGADLFASAGDVASLFGSVVMSQKVAALGALPGAVVNAVVVTGYGRSLEEEADAKAVGYLRTARYDPYALVRLFKSLSVVRDRLQMDADTYASSFINAEPGLEARAERVEGALAGE